MSSQVLRGIWEDLKSSRPCPPMSSRPNSHKSSLGMSSQVLRGIWEDLKSSQPCPPMSSRPNSHKSSLGMSTQVPRGIWEDLKSSRPCPPMPPRPNSHKSSLGMVLPMFAQCTVYIGSGSAGSVNKYKFPRLWGCGLGPLCKGGNDRFSKNENLQP